MAIYRTGALAGAISGTVGGVTFVTGGKSNVVRPRPITLHKTSPFLARSRARMHNLQNFWSTLTTLEQAAWNTAAHEILSTNTLGARSPMNGFQYFILTNKKAFPGFYETFPFPATLSPLDFAVDPAAAFSAAGAYNVQIDNPTAMTFLRLVVRGWPFDRSTVSRDVARLVFIQEITSDADPIVLNVRTAWIEHFGALQEGQRFAVGLTSQFTHSPFAPMTVLRQAVSA